MKPKFTNGREENAEFDALVSANRELDNLVDFYLWLDVHRKELLLL